MRHHLPSAGVDQAKGGRRRRRPRPSDERSAICDLPADRRRETATSDHVDGVDGRRGHHQGQPRRQGRGGDRRLGGQQSARHPGAVRRRRRQLLTYRQRSRWRSVGRFNEMRSTRAVLLPSSRIIGPILWGHSGPLCHALSLLLSLSLSWTSMRRRRATVATPGEWNVKLGRPAARSGEWAQHFSNASCYHNRLHLLQTNPVFPQQINLQLI